jgi:hypothetical protein
MTAERQLITEFENPRMMLSETQYGPMLFQDWCALEIKRIQAKGDDGEIVTSETGNIAIARKGSRRQ